MAQGDEKLTFDELMLDKELRAEFD